MKAIVSAENPMFRRWLRIAGHPRAMRSAGQTLAEGIHLAQAALAAGAAVDAAIVRRGAAHAEVQGLLDALPAALPRFELAATLYDRIAPVEAGAGLLLLLPIPPVPAPMRHRVDLVYLDGVQDPGNAGTLIRTAAAAGIQHVLASETTAALWAPKVLRAAMGAHFRIHLHEHVPPATLPSLLEGRWISAVAHGAPSLWQQDLGPGAVGWIFGGEGSGPSAQALAVSALQLCIPASAAVESLNVAAAAAVCLFERARRRLDR